MRYDEDDYDPDYGNPGEGPNKDRDFDVRDRMIIVLLGKEMVEEFQKVLKKWKERNEQLFGNSE